MMREGTLEDISDGKLYGLKDMVRADSCGCKNCSKCCSEYADTIILDPYDTWRLGEFLKMDFGRMIADGGPLRLQNCDGILLPGFKVNVSGSCVLLDGNGRCTVHAARPSICRIFPLGRYYPERGAGADREIRVPEGQFSYILQTGQCPAVCAKVRVDRWIDAGDLTKSQAFQGAWHYLVRDLTEALAGRDETQLRQLNIFVLKQFFLKPRDQKYIYQSLMNDISQVREMFGL